MGIANDQIHIQFGTITFLNEGELLVYNFKHYPTLRWQQIRVYNRSNLQVSFWKDLIPEEVKSTIKALDRKLECKIVTTVSCPEWLERPRFSSPNGSPKVYNSRHGV
jgi:hypothetical protein